MGANKREAPALWRERGSETARGLVDSVMLVRDGLRRSAVQLVEMMPCLAVFGEPIAQGPGACHDGENQQEEDHGPEVVPGQSLGQNVKGNCHLMNLQEALLLANLTTIIHTPRDSRQGDLRRSGWQLPGIRHGGRVGHDGVTAK